jgi:hypothetical protein
MCKHGHVPNYMGPKEIVMLLFTYIVDIYQTCSTCTV